MKRTGSNINGQNNDLNAADRAAQPHQLSAANHGNPDTTYSDHIKAPAFNRRTLGVASVLGLLFASLLAVTLFSTSADNSASSAPKFDAKTVSENTIFAFAQLKPAEFSTASNFYHSVLDPADVSNTPKAGGALAPSRNQGVAETSAAQPSSTDSARSQCSGAACASPRRAPVANGVTVKLFKLGVTKSALVSSCLNGRALCSPGDGMLLDDAKFALYKGRKVDEANKVGEYTVGKDGLEIPGLQPGQYVLKEVAAPAGYAVNSNVAVLEVQAGGKVRVGRTKFLKELVNNEFYFPNAKSVSTKVKLFKLGVETAYCDTDRLCTAGDGELLEGAKFALYEGTVVDEANKRGEFTVGKDGVELPVLQPNKTYVLKEVAAPTGYILNPTSRTLSVDKTGNVRYVKGKDLRSLNRNNNELYIPNLKAPVPEVSLFKLGVKDLADCSWGSCSAADGELLEGAEFALYEGTAADTDHQIGKTFTVGKDGLKIPGLQAGKTYTLIEVTSPAGYKVSGARYTFEVDADGKAKHQTDNGSQLFADNKIFVPNQKAAPAGVTVKLFKLGVTNSAFVKSCTTGQKTCSAADGDLIAGAKFVLYKGQRVDEANRLGEYVVGKDGLEIPGLQTGKYTLKEIEAPAGYEVNPNPAPLEVQTGGRVRVGRGKFFKTLVNNEFYFPNLKAVEPEVSLFKLGVKDLTVCDWSSCSAADGVLLEGAEFALYEGTVLDQAHKVGDNFTVGKDGLKIPGLQVGKTYSLVEVTSPAGYQVNRTDLTFEVDADGKAKYQTDAGSEFFVDNKIFVPNQKAAPPAVKFKLFKLGVTDSALVRNCTVASKMCSAADGELLEGAKFVLYKGQKVDEANRLGEYTVGKDGLEISDLQVNEYYTLQEVEAPAGYERNTNAAVLKVKSDGVVQRRISKIYRDLVDNEFYFPNLKEPIQTIDIALNKVSDKDIPLENVKFDLYEAANPDKPVQNITTGNDGKATLTVMPGVKYRLVETQTYPGYALLPQAIEFQVDANGTVTIDKQNGNVNTVTGGDKTLKVVNYLEGKLPLSGHAGSLQVLLIGLSLLLAAVTITLFERKRN